MAKSKEKSLITSKTKEKESKNAEMKEKPDDVKDKRENRLQHRHKTQQNEELIQESEISKGTYIILIFLIQTSRRTLKGYRELQVARNGAHEQPKTP